MPFYINKRCSDFTIADWWGYRKETSKDNDFALKGVSLILANTNNALNLLPILKMQLRQRTLEEAMKTNISLSHPLPIKETREQFWKDYRIMPFEEMVNKYMKPEKVSWSVNLRQHHKNTDSFLTFVNFLMIPQRAYRKFSTIVEILLGKLLI